MCIIDHVVKRVAKTKLFAMPSKDGTRQLTVYSNAVDTEHDSNVMCLPVPHPFSVTYESVPKEIFTQCKVSFPEKPKSIDYTQGMWLSARDSSDTPLVVSSHGSYDVVLVPSLYDFHRIPGTFATLSTEVKRFLFTNYPPEWGVILCKLKKGSVDYEPFAYSHNMWENTLFFPTKHYHLHSSGDTKADWDHELYLCYVGEQKGWLLGEKENVLSWAKMPSAFRVGCDYRLQQKVQQGAFWKNEDIKVSM